ncbi:cell division protein FtsQ/DivIB [Paenibacillus hexagrammi]|uniref:Cell division protein DivIB n=1 Tax=Paenibacillus hexagrammi TaxID=2908839 RepID=A0ABY3SPT3_9BACL|nr:FtsQ-type POTRA domain-containing protein [Paenibacillus sp. YPD9-1]UJF35140.1 FtsQ-type POTRA domain-containing protein [Paenibacillus sp. YPD9-1]
MPEERKVPVIPNPRPRSRSNRKLLSFLFIFFITVLIILFFQSSLSRISDIQIEGNELIPTDSIGQAAGIVAGDRFFATSSRAIEQRIKKLPMVKSAQVVKHFPGSIHIQVQEYPKVAFQITADGTKEAVLADGAVVTLKDGAFPLDKPILTGWSDDDPNKAALCKVLGDIPVGALADISEIKPDPSESYPDKIKLYTRSDFEVYTTITYLPEKIDKLPAYIASLEEENITSGMIRMLEVDDHAPFDTENNQNSGKSQTGGGSTKAAGESPTPKTTPQSTPKGNTRDS